MPYIFRCFVKFPDSRHKILFCHFLSGAETAGKIFSGTFPVSLWNNTILPDYHFISESLVSVRLFPPGQ